MSDKNRELPKDESNFAQVQGWRDRLKIAMSERQISMRRLSSLAGLGASTVRNSMTNSEDIGLLTLAKLADALSVPLVYLAAGVNAIYYGEQRSAKFVSIRALPILLSADVMADRLEPAVDHGHVAVMARAYPNDVQAMLVYTKAMEPEGLAHYPPPHTIVLPGDVVLFSRTATAIPGELVLARNPSGTNTMLRRLAAGETQDWTLLSHSHIYPRVQIKHDALIGRIVGVHRRLRQ